MRENKKFKDFIFENIKSREFYKLNGKTVFIIDINEDDGNQITVSFIHPDGKKDYCMFDNLKELNDTFKYTNDSFDTIKNTQVIKSEKFYNLVYYIGSKKIETIARNISLKQASILKNINKNSFKYKSGSLKIDDI